VKERSCAFGELHGNGNGAVGGHGVLAE
jgi:hypothetical protein